MKGWMSKQFYRAKKRLYVLNNSINVIPSVLPDNCLTQRIPLLTLTLILIKKARILFHVDFEWETK